MSASVPGGDTPAPSTTNAGNGTGQPGPTPTGWQWADDVKGFVENKGWTDPNAAVKSYMGLEKFHGVPPERLIKLPSDPAAPEWQDVYGKLGRPEKPEDYGIEGAAPEILARAHKLGLSKDQVKDFAAFLGEQAKAQTEKASAQAEEKREADVRALKTEWGQQYERNLDAADRAADRLGWSVEDIKAISSVRGTKRTLEMLAQLGLGLGEHGFVDSTSGGSDRSGFGMSREGALAKYQQMNGDPEFQKRLFSDDKAVRMAAVQERDQVARVAFPEDA